MKGFAVSFSMKREKQDAGDGSLSEKNYTAGGRKKRAGTGTLAVRMGAVPDGNAGTVWAGWRKDNDRTECARKPYLPGHPQICFNISHSGEYAACAFASIPIGMDLQQHRRAAWERMAERYFSAEDQKRLAAAENAETLFFRIWTEEESYGKWRGTGLSGSLGTEKKEGFCTHFSPEKGYEGAVWAAEPVKICMKRIEP